MFLFVYFVPIAGLILILTVGGGGAVIGGSIITHPYQLARIQSFLNPWLDPLGANYHIIQSFTAIGSGGILGFGIGESRLRTFYLPLHYSDFIFRFYEEGGLVLASIVVILFAIIFYRNSKLPSQKKYSFEQYLVCALVFYLVFQAVINMCVVSGLFPITGIPLTLISCGTSLLSSMFCLGVIHRIGAKSL